MYSPVTGDVFHATMERVFASFDRRPRPLRLIYAFPWEHNWLIRSGRVVVEDVRPAWWPAEPWWWRTAWVIVTYRIIERGAPTPPAPSLPRRLFRPQRAIDRWRGPNDQHFALKVPEAMLKQRGPA